MLATWQIRRLTVTFVVSGSTYYTMEVDYGSKLEKITETLTQTLGISVENFSLLDSSGALFTGTDITENLTADITVDGILQAAPRAILAVFGGVFALVILLYGISAIVKALTRKKRHMR